MIEIICNKDNSSVGQVESDSNIPMPKNVKQIGEIDSDKKIYIEDYAFTYINSIAYQCPEEEHAGVLLGDSRRNDTENYIFIKGVIKAKVPKETGKDGIYFDESVWEGIYSEIEKYFPNLAVVGWYAAVTRTTPEKMAYLKKIHYDNFAGTMKTLYVVDLEQKDENFYLYENNELKMQKGYVCFYERNYEMQEYMMDKRPRRSVDGEGKDKVMMSIRNIINEKEQEKKHKHASNVALMIAGFAACTVIFVGINMFSRYETIGLVGNALNNIADNILNISIRKDKDALTTSGDSMVTVNKLPGQVYPETEAATENIGEISSEGIIADDADETQSSEGADVDENNNAGIDETESSSQETADNQEGNVAGNQNGENAEFEIYIVQAGDTLSSICRKKYGAVTKLEEIIVLNSINNADYLYVGQEIKLP